MTESECLLPFDNSNEASFICKPLVRGQKTKASAKDSQVKNVHFSSALIGDPPGQRKALANA